MKRISAALFGGSALLLIATLGRAETLVRNNGVDVQCPSGWNLNTSTEVATIQSPDKGGTIELWSMPAVPLTNPKEIAENLKTRMNPTDLHLKTADELEQNGLSGVQADGTAKIGITPVQVRIVAVSTEKRAVWAIAFVNDTAAAATKQQMWDVLASMRPSPKGATGSPAAAPPKANLPPINPPADKAAQPGSNARVTLTATMEAREVGAKRYSLSATPKEGSLFRVRIEIYRGDMLQDAIESFQNTSGRRADDYFLVVDQAVLVPDTKDRYTVRTRDWTQAVAGRLIGVSSTKDGVTAEFETVGDGPNKFVISMGEEEYEAAKKRIPSLPPLANPWSFSQKMPKPAEAP